MEIYDALLYKGRGSKKSCIIGERVYEEFMRERYILWEYLKCFFVFNVDYLTSIMCIYGKYLDITIRPTRNYIGDLYRGKNGF